MLDHIILTVSDIKRSLAFYEAALKPLHISVAVQYFFTVEPINFRSSRLHGMREGSRL